MKTYFLQRVPAGTGSNAGAGREFIDDHLHDGHEKLASVEAESWKLDKQALLA